MPQQISRFRGHGRDDGEQKVIKFSRPRTKPDPNSFSNEMEIASWLHHQWRYLLWKHELFFHIQSDLQGFIFFHFFIFFLYNCLYNKNLSINMILFNREITRFLMARSYTKSSRKRLFDQFSQRPMWNLRGKCFDLFWSLHFIYFFL